jgi:hypothetical protein
MMQQQKLYKVETVSFYLAVVRDNNRLTTETVLVIKTLHNGKFENKFVRLLLRRMCT